MYGRPNGYAHGSAAGSHGSSASPAGREGQKGEKKSYVNVDFVAPGSASNFAPEPALPPHTRSATRTYSGDNWQSLLSLHPKLEQTAKALVREGRSLPVAHSILLTSWLVTGSASTAAYHTTFWNLRVQPQFRGLVTPFLRKYVPACPHPESEQSLT